MPLTSNDMIPFQFLGHGDFDLVTYFLFQFFETKPQKGQKFQKFHANTLKKKKKIIPMKLGA